MNRLVVAGAGVVGLLAALYASRLGLETIVLEAEQPGAGASTRNAGVLHLVQPPPGRLRRRLAPEGAREYRRLAAELGFHVYETSLLIPALRGVERAALPLVALLFRRWSRGQARTRIVSAEEARLVEPLLTRRARRVLVVEGYGVVNPRELVEALLSKLDEQGVEVRRGVRVESARCTREGVIVETSHGPVEAGFLVNAAGAGAAGIARSMGVRVEVRLVEGVMEVYRRPQVGSIIARLPLHVRHETKGGAVIPWPWQGTLFGPSYGPPPTGRVADAYAKLLEEPPEGRPDMVIRGYRTLAPDRDFHIITPEGCSRAVHLLGIESPGLTAAPVLAKMALGMIGAPSTSP